MIAVEELLYGMMLPSGNDAAQSLALYFGAILIHNGMINPNTYLTELEEKAIDERLNSLKKEVSKQIIPENESPEQRKKRL